MNIDKLEGRELAVLVHERIFGESVPDVSPNDSWWIHLPDYPGDIAAAWLVVEKISELWPDASERFVIYKSHYDDKWVVGWQTLAFLHFEDSTGWIDTDKLENYKAPMASADTAPLAICRAVLKAMEE